MPNEDCRSNPLSIWWFMLIILIVLVVGVFSLKYKNRICSQKSNIPDQVWRAHNHQITYPYS